jgi:hypothetical protein
MEAATEGEAHFIRQKSLLRLRGARQFFELTVGSGCDVNAQQVGGLALAAIYVFHSYGELDHDRYRRVQKSLVELVGIEPTTSSLRTMRSPS